jgi:hypothetical protein
MSDNSESVELSQDIDKLIGILTNYVKSLEKNQVCILKELADVKNTLQILTTKIDNHHNTSIDLWCKENYCGEVGCSRRSEYICDECKQPICGGHVYTNSYDINYCGYHYTSDLKSY